MNVETLSRILTYCPTTGAIRNIKTGREYSPDEQGSIVVYDVQTKTRCRLRMDRIAWELGNNKSLCKTKKILHLNLDPSDNTLNNLALYPRVVHREIAEAVRNLSGGIKTVPHPDDQYAYLLYYYHKGFIRKLVYYDIAPLKEKILQLRLNAAKLLNKYCLFD